MYRALVRLALLLRAKGSMVTRVHSTLPTRDELIGLLTAHEEPDLAEASIPIGRKQRKTLLQVAAGMLSIIAIATYQCHMLLIVIDAWVRHW
jgi:hypothetical protein